ncbi:MAG: alpha-E domain-containing protein, partial [Nitrospirales bacterium]
MLSRTAESFFWIGRYIERAEYTARFANVHYHLIMEIANWDEQAVTWQQYLEGNGEFPLYQELHGPLNTPTVLEFLTLNSQNPNSLASLVQGARANARGIQDQLSSEVWQHLNDFYLSLNGQTPVDLWSSPYRILVHIQNT